jgi:endonuclease YncB( thermonuclease family)
MPVKILAYLLLISFAKLETKAFPHHIVSHPLLVFFAPDPLPAPFNGKVIKIVDGDTYDVLTSDFKTIRIRMNGIDAPEKKQAFGTRSKDYLGSLCFGKTIKIVPISYDRNKRLIADSFTDRGLNLGREMLRAGYAWHYKKYSKDKKMAADEDHARKNRAGLWADNEPVAPWTFRSRR